MPIYEYQCTACGHEFEALQKMSDALLTDCPACAKPELRKMVSATSFHLKGKGWYQTDFKDTGKKTPADSSDGKTAASTEGKTTEAKPDSKSTAAEGKTTAEAKDKASSNAT